MVIVSFRPNGLGLISPRKASPTSIVLICKKMLRNKQLFYLKHFFENIIVLL